MTSIPPFKVYGSSWLGDLDETIGDLDEMFEAFEIGDLDEIKRLFSLDVDANHVIRQYGSDLLQSAILSGHKEVVEWMLSLPEVQDNLNIKNEFPTVAQGKSIEVAQLFLFHPHPKINIRLGDDETTMITLILALQTQNMELFEYLTSSPDLPHQAPFSFRLDPHRFLESVISHAPKDWIKKILTHPTVTLDPEHETYAQLALERKEIEVLTMLQSDPDLPVHLDFSSPYVLESLLHIPKPMHALEDETFEVLRFIAPFQKVSRLLENITSIEQLNACFEGMTPAQKEEYARLCETDVEVQQFMARHRTDLLLSPLGSFLERRRLMKKMGMDPTEESNQISSKRHKL